MDKKVHLVRENALGLQMYSFIEQTLKYQLYAPPDKARKQYLLSSSSLSKSGEQGQNMYHEA